MTLDRTALLAHLHTKADAQASLVAAAILDGLATAIERGDFDVEIVKKNTERSKNDGTSVV